MLRVWVFFLLSQSLRWDGLGLVWLLGMGTD